MPPGDLPNGDNNTYNNKSRLKSTLDEIYLLLVLVHPMNNILPEVFYLDRRRCEAKTAFDDFGKPVQMRVVFRI